MSDQVSGNAQREKNDLIRTLEIKMLEFDLICERFDQNSEPIILKGLFSQNII
jgi:hypothetical protein